DRGHRVAVAVQARLLRGVGPVEGPGAVGDDHVGGDRGAHQEPEADDQPHAGPEHLVEDAGVADRGVPETVGVERGEHRDQEDRDDHPDHDEQQDPGAADATRLEVVELLLQRVAHALSSSRVARTRSTSSGTSSAPVNTEVSSSWPRSLSAQYDAPVRVAAATMRPSCRWGCSEAYAAAEAASSGSDVYTSSAS